MSFGNPACADDIVVAPIPILDDLHKENPTEYPNSSILKYSNDTKDAFGVVSVPSYDTETDTLKSNELGISFKNTVVGTGNEQKYYQFNKDSRGINKLEEVESPSQGGLTFTVNYNKDVEVDKVDNVDIQNGRAYTNNNETDFVEKDLNINAYNVGFKNFSASLSGGAVYNKYHLKNLNGNFFANHLDYEDESHHSQYDGKGAAINNGVKNSTAQIDNISGLFVGNYINAARNADGGAIYNYSDAKIDNINANFIGNWVNTDGYTNNWYGFARGGAISNYGEIKDIKGDFVGNAAVSDEYRAYGGAIFNYGKIGDITGDFVGNYVEVLHGVETLDQLVEKEGFGESVLPDSERADGGAIHNWGGGVIGNIKGNFIGNYAKNAGSDAAFGGAIFNNNNSVMGNIEGDFIGNHIEHTGYYADGGAVYNFDNSVMGNIKGNFFGNYIKSSGDFVRGAAIFNQYGSTKDNEIHIKNADEDTKTIGSMGNVTGTFVGNYLESTKEKASVHGGAIYNNGQIGAVDDDGNVVGGIINSNFYGNYIKSKSDDSKGAAIFTTRALNIIADNGVSEFTGNYVEIDGKKDNQAIYLSSYKDPYMEKSESDVTMPEQEKYTPFTKQVTHLDNVCVDDNCYLSLQKDHYIGRDNTLSLIAKNNGVIIMNDKIGVDVNTEEDKDLTLTYVTDYYKNDNSLKEDGERKYYDEKGNELTKEQLHYDTVTINKRSVALKGDSTGKIYLRNNIEGFKSDGTKGAADVSLQGTNLYLNLRDDVLNGNNLTLDSGSISMINNTVGVSSLENMLVKQDTDFIGDVDLKNREMDRFESKNYGSHTGNVNVLGMNLLSDANPEDKVVAVYFAQPGLKNNVTNSLSMVPDEKYQNFTVYTPIYKYHFIYDKDHEYDGKGDGGYFVFTKGDKYFRPDASTGSTGNPSDAFNPAVLASPVTTQAASSAINETFRYVFEHADAFTQMPEAIREAKIYSDRYALSTEFNENLGSLCYCHEEDQNKAGWVRPYTTFESVDYKNGPTVDAVTYGTLMGYDTNFRHLKHGWHNVGTGYIGYTGSHLSYNGNDTNFNGGLLGLTETFYKGNFWTALTASVGAGVADTRTMYGKEDAAMLMAGVASKSGYNFEFKEGKYILQPIWQMSYTFVNTFDYTNAAGVRIDSDPSHSIQLNPKMRFIMNTKNGWQPYASVGMVWNIITHGSTSADGVILPNMRVKPYVEYGVGLQRSWNDKFTAFGQVMLRNGGRTGVALTAGFRWALGREEDNENYHHHKNEKVQNNKTNTVSMQTGGRKIIKQMDYAQKSAYKPQNTTRTTYRATIKQL